MVKDNTENILEVVWDLGSRGIIPGILVYAFYPYADAAQPDFPTEIWEGCVSVDPYKLYDDDSGNNWAIWWFNVCIHEWPVADKWQNIVKDTLKALVSQGALVAWTGHEGCFDIPPLQYASDIWAVAYEREVICSAELGKPFVPIDDEVLMKIRRHLGFEYWICNGDIAEYEKLCAEIIGNPVATCDIVLSGGTNAVGHLGRMKGTDVVVLTYMDGPQKGQVMTCVEAWLGIREKWGLPLAKRS